MKNLIRFLPVIFLTLFLVNATTLQAEVKLPAIFSDNMVVQRNKVVKVWGWASAGEKITVRFKGQQAKAKADKRGMWVVSLKPMTHGGPYEMQIVGKANTITLRNILIGDVWIGSGQSNMEWVLQNTNNAEQEIKAGTYPSIRLFTVNKAMSHKPEQDLPGGPWFVCTPQNVKEFSAVAYYFGRKLHQALDVPIGLINSSWGGTRIEPWISWDLMHNEAEYKNMDPAEHASKIAEGKKNQEKFLAALKHDRGLTERWFDPNGNAIDWKPIALPQEWSHTEIGNTDGIVWFRKDFEWSGSEQDVLTLSLGPIDDDDVTYLNGVEVGATKGWNRDRVYTVTPGVIKKGKNTLVVKVTDAQGGGGLHGKPAQLYLQSGDTKIDLSGAWQYKPSVLTSDFNVVNVGPNAFPSQLYNAMIAPIIQYPIRGVIWYQGEANTSASHNYRRLFPMLINDWRTKWGDEFPFLWVQLANYMAPVAQPGESGWAELREAQNKTLSVPKTGQAVIIDIGEADDIHPRNKRDVGERLALAALRVAYEKDVVCSGPIYESMQVEGDKVVLRFSNAKDGLQAYGDKYGYLKGFAIAGADKKFVWAKAFIQGDKVIVYNDTIKNPVAVRYGWGDNPDDVNLYNTAGLPASPFRTDDWKGITEGKR